MKTNKTEKERLQNLLFENWYYAYQNRLVQEKYTPEQIKAHKLSLQYNSAIIIMAIEEDYLYKVKSFYTQEFIFGMLAHIKMLERIEKEMKDNEIEPPEKVNLIELKMLWLSVAEYCL